MGFVRQRLGWFPVPFYNILEGAATHRFAGPDSVYCPTSDPPATRVFGLYRSKSAPYHSIYLNQVRWFERSTRQQSCAWPAVSEGFRNPSPTTAESSCPEVAELVPLVTDVLFVFRFGLVYLLSEFVFSFDL